MREAVLLVVAVSAFAGFALRGVDGPKAAEEADPVQLVAERDAKERDRAFAAWSAGETVLPRASNGHFYAEASVNGSSVNFLVDTGASMIALTGEDATAAGLSWSESDVRIVAQGASGPVYGVPVRLDHVVLGGHEADNVDAAIIPRGLDISLLGQSFLSTIEPVRIEGDRLVLGG
ncbi:retropepsin-like aspartic protease family protein [Erythrobacter mangrovi]|uniref:TIGR02281 family clan AA aspartic protease n=1 Tax=Erythrobacter mangrovi TaxID=2739433 RepID=A0A7D3XNS8_9SPHN|nr:TIGR02281 family clan AA aspartic protease [Erythrobacter mangrovi]QKG70554.1 TIGR02281 family clan AA aspartic protease [Erythrobacter mangrovi]